MEAEVADEMICFEGENTIVEIRINLYEKFWGLESEEWLDIPLKVDIKIKESSRIMVI